MTTGAPAISVSSLSPVNCTSKKIRQFDEGRKLHRNRRDQQSRKHATPDGQERKVRQQEMQPSYFPIAEIHLIQRQQEEESCRCRCCCCCCCCSGARQALSMWNEVLLSCSSALLKDLDAASCCTWNCQTTEYLCKKFQYESDDGYSGGEVGVWGEGTFSETATWLRCQYEACAMGKNSVVRLGRQWNPQSPDAAWQRTKKKLRKNNPGYYHPQISPKQRRISKVSRNR